MDILALAFFIAGAITGVNGLLITSIAISGFCFVISFWATILGVEGSHGFAMFIECAILVLSIIFLVM